MVNNVPHHRSHHREQRAQLAPERQIGEGCLTLSERRVLMREYDYDFPSPKNAEAAGKRRSGASHMRFVVIYVI